jgi:hypothetical protein
MNDNVEDSYNIVCNQLRTWTKNNASLSYKNIYELSKSNNSMLCNVIFCFFDDTECIKFNDNHGLRKIQTFFDNLSNYYNDNKLEVCKRYEILECIDFLTEIKKLKKQIVINDEEHKSIECNHVLSDTDSIIDFNNGCKKSNCSDFDNNSNNSDCSMKQDYEKIDATIKHLGKKHKKKILKKFKMEMVDMFNLSKSYNKILNKYKNKKFEHNNLIHKLKSSQKTSDVDQKKIEYLTGELCIIEIKLTEMTNKYNNKKKTCNELNDNVESDKYYEKYNDTKKDYDELVEVNKKLSEQMDNIKSSLNCYL